MNCIFIYNPNSGKGKIEKKLPYILKRLQTKFDCVDVYATKARGDLTRKVKEVADSYDCIVFSGGDGTFNELLRGIGDREELPLLGYLPSGTTNDVAHSLKIPRKNLKKALNVILTGKKEMLDCMRVNGSDYVMYVLAAGAFTRATYTTPQTKKRRFGVLAYAFEAVFKNLPFRVFPVTVKQGEEEKTTVGVLTLLISGRSVAGLMMNKKASMQDGEVEGLIVRQSPNPNFFQRMHALFTIVRIFLFGHRRKRKNVESFSGEKFRIEAADDVVWSYDGERGAGGSLDIEVLKRKVPMLVPKNNKNI